MEVSQCSSWTSCSCPSLLGSPWRLHRCCFFGQGFLVVVSGGVGQTIQNTVENPQLQFWDKVFMPVCCVWCLWPDSVGTVEIPQQQFLDRVYMPVVAGLVPMARQCRKLWLCRSCSSSQSLFSLSCRKGISTWSCLFRRP